MSDNLINELRSFARTCDHGWPNGAPDFFPDPKSCLRCDRYTRAADEIERLRGLVVSLETEKDMWESHAQRSS